MVVKLKYKQEMVPKEGKGKYNVTVPVPYEFLKQEKKESIRERKLKQMLREKEKKVVEETAVTFKANDIPRTTKEPLYQRILARNEQRRSEVRRLSLALTKQREKPFSFYERDKNKVRVESVGMEWPQFRANKIPWKVLVPLYKRMVDKIEYERE